MNQEEFRITTAATDALLDRLAVELKDLDAGLARIGYQRLDPGAPPRREIALISALPGGPGQDPGHRVAAARVMTILLYVIYADGVPAHERLVEAARMSADAVDTDEEGKRIIAALAAYHAQRPPHPPSPGRHGIEHMPDTADLARLVARAAQFRGVVSDVSLDRALAVGKAVPGWEAHVLGALRPDQPLRRARRHDAADYERHGMRPPIAELAAWLKAHPGADTRDYERHARFVGEDPYTAAVEIMRMLEQRQAIGTEMGGPDSTT